MTRGYLWENLPREVDELFLSLSSQIDPAEIALAGFSVGSLVRLNMDWLNDELAEEERVLGKEWCAKLRAKRRGAELTPTQRQAVIRARRANEGRCVECENERETDNARCTFHRQKQIAYCRARRAKRKP